MCICILHEYEKFEWEKIRTNRRDIGKERERGWKIEFISRPIRQMPSRFIYFAWNIHRTVTLIYIAYICIFHAKDNGMHFTYVNIDTKNTWNHLFRIWSSICMHKTYLQKWIDVFFFFTEVIIYEWNNVRTQMSNIPTFTMKHESEKK